jgi:hypothetical protein
MASTTGTTVFDLNMNDLIEEAFERCGQELRTGYNFRTARRSLNILTIEWANRGLNQWTIQRAEIALNSSNVTYTLPADTIDIISAAVRLPTGVGTASQSDLIIERISRDYYLSIPAKLTLARPTQFYVDRQIIPILYVWPKPDQSYTLVVDKLVRMDDASSGMNTLQMPFRFYPCLAAGLAYYIAMKKAPDRVQLLKAVYEEEFDRAKSEDRDRASLMLTPVRDWYRV